jgi:hypothetical protein
VAGPYVGHSNQEVTNSNGRAPANAKGFGGFTCYLVRRGIYVRYAKKSRAAKCRFWSLADIRRVQADVRGRDASYLAPSCCQNVFCSGFRQVQQVCVAVFQKWISVLVTSTPDRLRPIRHAA